MYAVLHVADFALQAILRTESDGQTTAAALFDDTTRKSVVLAANPNARAAGVFPGMTASQAVARCPTLRIRTALPDAEAEARAVLHAIGFTISPRIEDTAPGVCTIDLTGATAAHYNPALDAAVRQLQRHGFVASGGIGATPLLALYAARAATPTEPSDHSPDDPASYVLTVSDADAFLAPLPLAAAEPPPHVAEILTRWGLHTFADIRLLSRDDVGRRLGPEGLALWDRVQGGTSRPLRPVAPKQTFSAEMAFEHEIETLEPLLFVLRRFLERLTLELRTGGYVAAVLELTLRLADDQQHTRQFRLPEPTADTDILFRALHTHLEALRTKAGITALRLRIEPARPLVRQQGLFDTGLRDPHGFAETLARIEAIVGADRVGTPQLLDTHRPDAVKLVAPPPVIPPASEPLLHPPVGAPLRRFRPPLRTQLELTDGRPTYLWTEAFQGAVAEIRGPWLSSGDWWQPDRAWRRTEYDVRIANGGLYRLVYSEGAWWVEGEYD